MSSKDLTGEKFGRLKAIKRERIDNRTYYYCKCECGNTIRVRADSLTSGNTKSCGCLSEENKFKAKDITNKTFGSLKALRRTDKKESNGSIIWECECECGNPAYVSAGDLISGKIKSCGCKMIEASKNNIKKATKIH